MQRKRVRELLRSGEVGSSVMLQGWVRTRRDSKGFSFLEINDGSCMSNIQAIADAELAGYQENVLQAHTGAAVEIHGELVESPGKGQRVEVRATDVRLVGGCSADDYPLQKKRHSNEYLRTIAHLRPRTNTFGAAFRTRHALAYSIHEFFHERGFYHLHTPIISTSDCEGAGEMFRVSTLDAANPPRLKEKGDAVDFSKDFFAEETSLTVSGQLEAESFALALSDVYTFGPTFRAENSNTSRHLAEFWMIEPEMAFCDLSGNADLGEALIKHVVRFALENCEEDMQFFNKWIEKGIIDSLEHVLNSDFERMSYTEAVDILQKSGKKFEYPVEWGCDLQSEHERFITEEHVGKPVFLTDYPKEIKAFYMRANDDQKTVAAMDLLVPRIGEIIGGSQREEREDVLRSRIKESNLPEEPYWWYLDLRKYGSVPHAGFGVGFERLMMFLTGIQNVRDVIPFPRTPGNAQF